MFNYQKNKGKLKTHVSHHSYLVKKKNKSKICDILFNKFFNEKLVTNLSLVFYRFYKIFTKLILMNFKIY